MKDRDCKCSNSTERRRAGHLNVLHTALDAIGFDRLKGLHNRSRRHSQMCSVVHGPVLSPVTQSTMAPVTQDKRYADPRIVSTIPQDRLAICCWKTEGDKGCPDLKGSHVQEFKETFSGMAHQIAYNKGQNRSQKNKRISSLTGVEYSTDDYTVAEMEENGITTFDEEGEPDTPVSLLELFVDTRPCPDTRDRYGCKNPNFVTEARLINPVYLAPPSRFKKAHAQALCKAVEKAREQALKAVLDIAQSNNCPRALGILGAYCPERVIKRKPHWDVQLAMWTGQNWVGGAIITVPVDCLNPEDPPPPEIRQPEDPAPPDAGGTPTPPDGGGTPTPGSGGDDGDVFFG